MARSPSHRGCFQNASSKVVAPGAPASHVRDRPHVHHCGPTSPCAPQRPTRLPQHRQVKARPPGLERKRRLTNNCAAAASSVSAFAPRQRNSLSIKSSFNPLSTSHVATTQGHARLARLLASAFAWLNTSNRSRWQSH